MNAAFARWFLAGALLAFLVQEYRHQAESSKSLPPERADARALERRRISAACRALMTSRIVDDLAAGIVRPDEAASQFREVLADEPELLAQVCRCEGTDDEFEACRRRLARALKDRPKR